MIAKDQIQGIEKSVTISIYNTSFNLGFFFYSDHAMGYNILTAHSILYTYLYSILTVSLNFNLTLLILIENFKIIGNK